MLTQGRGSHFILFSRHAPRYDNGTLMALQSTASLLISRPNNGFVKLHGQELVRARGGSFCSYSVGLLLNREMLMSIPRVARVSVRRSYTAIN